MNNNFCYLKMADNEKKPPHKPQEKRVIDDDDTNYKNKKMKGNDSGETSLLDSDNHIVNDDKEIREMYITNQKRWIDEFKDVIKHQEAIINNYRQSISVSRKKKIKYLINKREKYVEKINKIDDSIRVIENNMKKEEESEVDNITLEHIDE